MFEKKDRRVTFEDYLPAANNPEVEDQNRAPCEACDKQLSNKGYEILVHFMQNHPEYKFICDSHKDRPHLFKTQEAQQDHDKEADQEMLLGAVIEPDKEQEAPAKDPDQEDVEAGGKSYLKDYAEPELDLLGI